MIEQGSPEWLAARLGGIGGSEISALYRKADGTCAHPWISQTELWALKTGRITAEQPSPFEAPHLYVGRVLEGPVREMYSTYSGRTVTDGVTLRRDALAPVLLASTDGTQECPDRPGEPGVYEGKVTTVFRRRDWIDRDDDGEQEIVPLHYRCQVQHYMACEDYSWGSVVAFMQGDRAPIHWRDLDRHDAFISDMRERASRWWRDYVEADTQPPADDSEATEQALRKIHRDAEEVAVWLPAAFAGVVDRLDAIADFRKALDSERQRLRNLILSTMGTAALGIIADDGRGWSLRGKSGRSLRALTSRGIERVRRTLTLRSTYVPTNIGRQLDELFAISSQVFAPGQTLDAKAIHIAHIAATAAHRTTQG